MAVQIAGEDPLAQGNTLARAHLAKAQRVPRGFLAFDNEGGSVAVETVGVRPDPAVLGLLEDEGESLEQLVRAQPDEFVLAGVHGGLEDTIMGSAHPAVDAIGSNDQVRIGVEGDVIDLGFEHQVYAQFLGACLQDVEQVLAADPHESVAAGSDGVPLEVDVDIVPVSEVAADFGGAFRIVGLEVSQRFVGENHAPAKGVIGAVALNHMNVVIPIVQFHGNREIQRCRTSTDTYNLHGSHTYSVKRFACYEQQWNSYILHLNLSCARLRTR